MNRLPAGRVNRVIGGRPGLRIKVKCVAVGDAGSALRTNFYAVTVVGSGGRPGNYRRLNGDAIGFMGSANAG